MAKHRTEPAAAVLAALSMLGLPLPGERADRGPMTLSDEQRAALRSRMPKRWQDRMDDSRLQRQRRTRWLATEASSMSKRFPLLLALSLSRARMPSFVPPQIVCTREIECSSPKANAKAKTFPTKRDKVEALKREIGTRGSAWSEMTDAEKAEHVKRNGVRPLPKEKPLVISPSAK